MLIPLKTLISQLDEDKELKPLLYSFSCEQDEDIEHFLHNRAIEFDKLSKARTYLIFSEEDLLSKNITGQVVYGYISIALKVLSVPEVTSNRMRKELDGFSSKIHGERISDFPCYLIGQLSRNSKVPKDCISGKQLLTFAEDVIGNAVNSVGGRYMMIECRDKEKVIRFYQQNEFEEISRIPDEEQPMVQMIRKIS